MEDRDLAAFGAVRSRTALARGATPKALRGPRWVHPHHGVVRPSGSDLEATPAALAVADAVALMTTSCALGGWASRWVQGGAYCDGWDRGGGQRDVLVHCGPGAQLRKRAGIEPCEARLLPGELVDLEQITVASLARSVYDDMRMAANVNDALVELEMAVSTTIPQARTTLDNVSRLVDRHVKTRGIVQARRAVRMASSRSASPWETRTRRLAIDGAGISNWLVNIPVFDLDGRLLGVPDMLEARTGLVIESDGAGHRDEATHADDNRREEAFERAGLVVVRIAAYDHRDRAQTIARIRAAHHDAQDTVRRAWSLEKPAWWHTWHPGRRWD